MDNKKTTQQQKLVNQDELKKMSQGKNVPNTNIEINLLKKQLEEYKKIAEDNKSKYLRAIADYQNLENRASNNNQQLLLTANSGLILKLLPFLDSLDKAEVFVKDQGLKLVKDHFHKTLTDCGLEQIEVLNKEYDPYLAEVIDMVEGEKDNIVVEVLRRGYKFHDKVLRVAQVKVSKKSEVRNPKSETNPNDQNSN
jgi:molecular chaperone GrpE